MDLLCPNVPVVQSPFPIGRREEQPCLAKHANTQLTVRRLVSEREDRGG
jgi:hypothetical protein